MNQVRQVRWNKSEVFGYTRSKRENTGKPLTIWEDGKQRANAFRLDANSMRLEKKFFLLICSWFTSNLANNAHFNRRLTIAQGAFMVIKHLTPPGAGLSSLQTRHLIFSLLYPIAAYGTNLLMPTSGKTDSASDLSAWRPVRSDLRCNALPHPTLPDATWQRLLHPDATRRPPYVWTTSDSFSHLFFLLMRR